MKRSILALCTLLLSVNAFSQKSNFGLGVMLGNPTGVSAKLWTGEKIAVDAAFGYRIGVEDHLRFNADYLFHPWSFNVEQDILKPYFGAGFGLGFISDFSVSVRVPVGAAYFFQPVPLEVFAEIAPGFQIIGPGDTRFCFEGYLGVRWYF
ncbi:MAG: hypothetical protein ABFS10_03855 [Bacteroidota bacterium]